jgi:biotin synthase
MISKLKQNKKTSIRRLCIQTMNYPKMFEELVGLITEIKINVDIPISVSCQPLEENRMRKLAEAGIERLGIPLDASTETIFMHTKGSKVNGLYRWQDHLQALKTAVKVFGKGKVSTHLIAGLGESDKEILYITQKMRDYNVNIGLFSFTPIHGTKLENIKKIPLSRYRRIQLAHYLITRKKTRFENMNFTNNGELSNLGIPKERLVKIIRTGTPFKTSGCPDCNRPFYNERPGGPIYNYPRDLRRDEIVIIESDLPQILLQMNN